MLVGLPVSGSRCAGMPFLPMNGPTPKPWCVVYFVFAAGRGRRYTEIVGLALCQAVLRIEVAARGIAHHLDGELRIDARAVRPLRRPRQPDAEQAALEQQRVRAADRLRQVRAVRAIDRREQRILALGRRPSARGCCVTDSAHAVRRLVAGDAGAAVGADRLEERMALGLHAPGGVVDAHFPALVCVAGEFRQGIALPGRPPRIAHAHPPPSRRLHSRQLPAPPGLLWICASASPSEPEPRTHAELASHDELVGRNAAERPGWGTECPGRTGCSRAGTPVRPSWRHGRRSRTARRRWSGSSRPRR